MTVKLNEKHCIPCEGGMPPFSEREENFFQKEVPSWNIDRSGTHKIIREFTHKDFKEAMVFVNQIADIAEEEGHHPDIYIFYNRVRIELHTHALCGLSENDFIVAAKIDQL